MPWWMDIYIFFYIVILVFNVFFHIKHKAKKKILFYEILSTVYLLFMITAYWYPALFLRLGMINILAILIILGVDFYFTIWGKIEDIGLKNIPKMSKRDIENAKAVSLIIASPAYITSFLVALYIIQFKLILF